MDEIESVGGQDQSDSLFVRVASLVDQCRALVTTQARCGIAASSEQEKYE